MVLPLKDIVVGHRGMSESDSISFVFEIRNQFTEDFQIHRDKNINISFNSASLNCTLSTLSVLMYIYFLEDKLA